MIDLHCHILPNIDDGAQSIQDSIDMAKMAVEQGITHILCTPHHNNGKYDNPAGKVISCVEVLQQELIQQGISLMLYEGQEIRISGDLIEQINRNEILFVDLSNRYLLIEFPTNDVPAYTEHLFYELLSNNYIPIIVHPERNRVFIENPEFLFQFIEMGVLTQLTAPSYVGVFGKEIEKTAKLMVSHNMIHMVASDAHNIERRGFFMKKAYAAIAKDHSSAYVEHMKQTARNVINGEDVRIPELKKIKRKRFGFI